MAFRIQKDANLDYLQANNVVSSSINKQIIYLNSGGSASDQSYIGIYGNSATIEETMITVPISGSFTRIFASNTDASPGDQLNFTVFVNGSPIATTTDLIGGPSSQELSFISPTSVPYQAGDQIAVLLTVVVGNNVAVSLTLI